MADKPSVASAHNNAGLAATAHHDAFNHSLPAVIEPRHQTNSVRMAARIAIPFGTVFAVTPHVPRRGDGQSMRRYLSILNRLRKRSTCPVASTMRCVPV
jgi:hypothetical protein